MRGCRTFNENIRPNGRGTRPSRARNCLRPGGAPSIVARVLPIDGLLGQPVPTGWDDVGYALKAAGRAQLTAEDRARLGALADRFPLFGLSPAWARSAFGYPRDCLPGDQAAGACQQPVPQGDRPAPRTRPRPHQA
jgi:hypothetical protein